MELKISKTNVSFAPAAQMSVAAAVKGIQDYENNNPALMRINFRPAYQRSEAWNEDFKEKLILSVIVNYPIGNIILRELNHNPASYMEVTHEVVDGQQRLLTLKQFINGDFKLGYETSKSILKEKRELFEFDDISKIKNNAVKIYKKYNQNPDLNIKLGFQDLPTALQTQINAYPLVVIFVNADDEAIAQYFRFVQNQERLRAGEIINSIPDSFLQRYLFMIENKEMFLKKINWKESRKEFDKIFYSMIGVFEKKLNFGTTDISIIEYASNSTEINEEGDTSARRMINAINAVSDCEINNSGRFSKRLIKFFLLSAGFGIVDFTSNTNLKFKALLRIESKLPSFNSGDFENVRKALPNYPEDIVEKYNKLFILGRGSHSPKSTYETLRLLSDLVEYELRSLIENEN